MQPFVDLYVSYALDWCGLSCNYSWQHKAFTNV